ncbi:MAG: glycosyltransferase family 39 protein [Sediminibacterium sp.]
MHILFQPNFLDVFFWTLSSYCIVCWINSDNKKYLYFLGISFGLGVLGKYSMLFYIAAFGLSVVITNRRKWLANPHFYFAMLIGILICLPNLLWQYEHHFPLMHHMDLLTRQHQQLLMTIPSFYVWIGGLFYIALNKTGKNYLSLLVIYIAIIAMLLYFNGKGYYAAAIYPTIMAFGGIGFAGLVMRKGFGWLTWATPMVMLFITWRILPLFLPNMSPEKLSQFYQSKKYSKPALIWEDKKEHSLPQDFADMLGWKEMAEKTAKVYQSLPDSIKQHTMVYGDNYGEAGALSFYGKKLGLPEIYSDDASYLFWLPDHFTKKYFLFVCDDLPDADDAFFNHWHKREILDSVTQKYAREYRTKIILYSQPDDSVRIIAEQHIIEGKKQFNFQ